MISRCPSCGDPSASEDRLCRCGWDFVANKRGDKRIQLEEADPKAAVPPPAADTTPPLRESSSPAPAENPFSIPIARRSLNPGEGLFSAPSVSEPKPKESVPETLFSAPLADSEPKPVGRAPEPAPVQKAAAKLVDTPPSAPVERSVPPAAITSRSASKDAPKLAGRRSGAYLAATSIGALGLVSGVAVVLLLRSEPQGSAPSAKSSLFGKRANGEARIAPALDVPVRSAPVVQAPAPAPPPLETPKNVHTRPTATFAAAPRPKPAPVSTSDESSLERPAVMPAEPKKKAEDLWVFEGLVYDLLSTRAVYGARIIFVNAENKELESVESGSDGRYRASIKPGPPEGYVVRIAHEDYTGKLIDEIGSSGDVRRADLKQRQFLMRSGAPGLPWIGSIGKPVFRDVALIPTEHP